MTQVTYEIPEAPPRAWEIDEAPMPETPLHDAIIELLKLILRAWAAREARSVLVGSNIAVRWVRANPRIGCDPDVYVVEPPPPEGDDVESLCLWKPGHHAPRVAVEVVSGSNADKDYLLAPEKYAACGTGELWIFDPLRKGPQIGGGPHVLQIWERKRGRMTRTYAGAGPARSPAMGAWLVVTDGGKRLRLADDEHGTALWPTDAEDATARAVDATARAEDATARAAEANAEVARLRAELLRVTKKRAPRR